MPQQLVILNDHKFLQAEFQRLHPTNVERGKAVLAMKFLTNLSQQGKHSSAEMRDEALKYKRRLDQALLGEGPLDGVVGDLLTGAKIGIELFAKNPVFKTAAEVAKEALEFSFIRNWNADEKALTAARATLRVAEYGQLLDSTVQTFYESCTHNAACSRAAVTVFPNVARAPGPEPSIAITPAEIVTFLEEDPILVNTGAHLRSAERQSDGSINLHLDLEGFRASLTADFQQLTAGIHDASAKATEEIQAMRERQETVISWVETQKAAAKDRREAEEVARQRREIIDTAGPLIQDARAGLGLVVAVMGAVDPKLAKQVSTVGTAVINVAETGIALVQTAVNLSQGIGAVFSAGTAAATGNFIGAAISLIGLFLDTGPSPEQMILDEIGKIREEMREFRRDVHDRFNRIDEKLDRIYEDVIKQLDKIDVKLGRIDDKVDDVLTILAKQSAALERIDRSISDYFQASGRNDLEAAMSSALLRPSRSQNPLMSADDYQLYEGLFLTWAVTTSRSPVEAPTANRALDDASLYSALSDESEIADNFAFITEVIHDREWPGLATTPDGQKAPNPRTWMIAASAFSQLESEWPQLAVRFNSKDLHGRRSQVRAGGEQLAAIQRSIENGPTLDGKGILHLACDAVRNRTRELGQALESEADIWEAEQRDAVAQGSPYVPVWRPTKPESDFPYTPSVRSELDQTTIPKGIAQYIPVPYRSVAFFKRDEEFSAVVEHADTQVIRIPAGPGGTKPVTLTTCTAQVVIRFRNQQIQRLVGVSGAKVVPPTASAEWWRMMLPHLGVDPTYTKSGEAEEAAWNEFFDACSADCATRLFPELGHACVDMARRGGRLWQAASNYGGARALLVALVSLAMPVERKQQDLLRALFDGSPKPYGGTSLPTVPHLAALLAHNGKSVPRSIRSETERPLEAFVINMVTEALDRFEEFLDNRRGSTQSSAISDPALAEALLRLDLSQGIVQAAYNSTATPPGSNDLPASYVVQAGDTLSSIARKFNIAGGWEAIYLANQKIIGDDPDHLPVGIKLNLRLPA